MQLMTDDIKRDVLPILYGERPGKVRDAKPVMKPEEAIPLLNLAIGQLDKIIDKYNGSLFVDQYGRIAEGAVRAATAEASNDFTSAMENAVGIDVEPLYKDLKFQLEVDGVVKTVDMNGMIKYNTQLIKTIPQTYMGPMKDTLEQAVLQGWTSSEMSDVILYEYGDLIKQKYLNQNSEYIAKRIARDQMSKIYSQTTNQRQKDTGIDYFQWQTSNDSRVSGDPSGLYPEAKTKCYEIAKQDVGYGKGVYTTAEGASWAAENNLFPGAAHVQCRCVSIPLIDGVNYDSATGKVIKPKMPKGTT